jgi:hypothetical protein
MIYRPKFFDLQELVGPEIFKFRGGSAWELLDAGALLTLDRLRQRFGPITVNNWNVGGKFTESGYREWDTKTGAKFSMHKFGKAFDCKFAKVTVREAADFIIANHAEYPHLTTIEDPDATKTWLHIDCRNNPEQKLRIVHI